jgi:hypothetical protein
MAEAKTIRARYVGDPRTPNEPVPDLYDAFDTTFEAGKFSEVDAAHADKLRGNDHFEVQGEKKPAAREETGESSTEFAARIEQITDREGLEAMLKDEKRPVAKATLERRIAALPPAPAA